MQWSFQPYWAKSRVQDRLLVCNALQDLLSKLYSQTWWKHWYSATFVTISFWFMFTSFRVWVLTSQDTLDRITDTKFIGRIYCLIHWENLKLILDGRKNSKFLIRRPMCGLESWRLMTAVCRRYLVMTTSSLEVPAFLKSK